MLFNSYEFLFAFLPLTLLVYYALGRGNRLIAAAWLALASVLFYGWARPQDVYILAVSVGVNLSISRAMFAAFAKERAGFARALLILGLIFNLLLLGAFKYTNFLIENLNMLLDLELRPTAIALPLGISFYTFTQIAYLVDTYRERLKPFGMVHYGLFVTYFPHLVAGPILHHRDMLPQFASRRVYLASWRNLAAGLTVFVIGLSKKLLIADQMAPYADAAFNGSPQALTAWTAWGAALAYTLQIYFDFSGYSDMAVGLARMLGARIPWNFASPYQATNIIEFWRRWHITLSRFLRDYLYIPLGGNRRGPGRRYLNLMITMILGGLWHGASWNFAIWGTLHGVYLMVNHGWRRLSGESRHPAVQSGIKPLVTILKRPLTLIAVVVAWVFFRAETLGGAKAVLSAMFSLSNWPMPKSVGTDARIQLAFLGAAGMIALFAPNTQHWLRIYLSDFRRPAPAPRFAGRPVCSVRMIYAVVTGLLLAACLIKMKTVAGPEFIYYNF